MMGDGSTVEPTPPPQADTKSQVEKRQLRFITNTSVIRAIDGVREHEAVRAKRK